MFHMYVQISNTAPCSREVQEATWYSLAHLTCKTTHTESFDSRKGGESLISRVGIIMQIKPRRRTRPVDL